MKPPILTMLAEYAALAAALLIFGSYAFGFVAGATIAPLARVTELLK